MRVLLTLQHIYYKTLNCKSQESVDSFKSVSVSSHILITFEKICNIICTIELSAVL